MGLALAFRVKVGSNHSWEEYCVGHSNYDAEARCPERTRTPLTFEMLSGVQ